jgi:hypothetical protein
MKRASLRRTGYFMQLVEGWLEAMQGDEKLFAVLIKLHARLEG